MYYGIFSGYPASCIAIYIITYFVLVRQYPYKAYAIIVAVNDEKMRGVCENCIIFYQNTKKVNLFLLNCCCSVIMSGS